MNSISCDLDLRVFCFLPYTLIYAIWKSPLTYPLEEVFGIRVGVFYL